MSETIERVKAAIAEKCAPAIDARAPYAKVMFDMAAKAAIEAMREPTELMVKAGANFVWFEGRTNELDDVATTWRAMVDAALKKEGMA